MLQEPILLTAEDVNIEAARIKRWRAETVSKYEGELEPEQTRGQDVSKILFTFESRVSSCAENLQVLP